MIRIVFIFRLFLLVLLVSCTAENGETSLATQAELDRGQILACYGDADRPVCNGHSTCDEPYVQSEMERHLVADPIPVSRRAAIAAAIANSLRQQGLPEPLANYPIPAFDSVPVGTGPSILLNGYNSILRKLELFKNLDGDIVPLDKTQPFTGSGATGMHPSKWDFPELTFLPLIAKGTNAESSVVDKISGVYIRYGNPATGGYWQDRNGVTRGGVAHRGWRNEILDDEIMAMQASKLLLDQSIVTLFPQAYSEFGRLPTRKEIINLAAKRYGLQPALLAAVILNEQHDQSHNEDLAEFYEAARFGRDSSIGLGQVLVSTAVKRDAFSGILPNGIRSTLRANGTAAQYEQLSWRPTRSQTTETAWLLSSEELNIFASAKYVRWMADLASDLEYVEDHFNDSGESGEFFRLLHEGAMNDLGITPEMLAGHSAGWNDRARQFILTMYTGKPYKFYRSHYSSPDEETCYPLGWGTFALDTMELMYDGHIFSRPPGQTDDGSGGPVDDGFDDVVPDPGGCPIDDPSCSDNPGSGGGDGSYPSDPYEPTDPNQDTNIPDNSHPGGGGGTGPTGIPGGSGGCGYGGTFYQDGDIRPGSVQPVSGGGYTYQECSDGEWVTVVVQ